MKVEAAKDYEQMDSIHLCGAFLVSCLTAAIALFIFFGCGYSDIHPKFMHHGPPVMIIGLQP